MAKTPAQVQSKIDTKVWGNTNLINTVVINRYTINEDEFGGDEPVFDSQITKDAIVLDYTSKSYKYDKSGLYNDSSLILLFRYDVELSDSDEITVYNNNYKLSQYSGIPYGDSIMVRRAFVKPI